jgi:hypothetical protein
MIMQVDRKMLRAKAIESERQATKTRVDESASASARNEKQG